MLDEDILTIKSEFNSNLSQYYKLSSVQSEKANQRISKNLKGSVLS